MAINNNSARADADISNILKKLRTAMGDVKEGTNVGLRTLAIQIERGSKKRVPREFGGLVNSGYQKKSGDMQYEIGFTADYAVHVHENLEMKLKGKKRPSGKGVYWGPAGEARFLSKAIDAEVPTAAETIRKQAAVKKAGQQK